MAVNKRQSSGISTLWFALAGFLSVTATVVFTLNDPHHVDVSLDHSVDLSERGEMSGDEKISTHTPRKNKKVSAQAANKAPAVERSDHQLPHNEAAPSTGYEPIYTIDDVHRTLDEGSIEDAEAMLEKILANEPNNDEALHILGRIYLDAKDDPESARTFLERAAQANPGSEEIISDLLSVFRRQGALGAGLEFLASIPEWKRQGGAVDHGIASALIQEGRVEESISYFKEALDKGEIDSVSANNQLAEAYLQTDRPEAAIETLHRAIAQEPDPQRQKELQLSLAIVHYEDAGPERAIEVLTELVKRHPDDDEVKDLLGMMVQIKDDETIDVSFKQTHSGR